MQQAIATVLRKSAGLFTGNGKPGAPALLGRRMDDLFVIAIGVVLALFFVAQVGWLILSRSHP